MQERIRSLAKGAVEFQKCEVLFSTARIEMKVLSGHKERGELRIYNRQRAQIRGLLYSTNPHLTLKSPNFSGSDCTVSYEVDFSREPAGSVQQGEIQVVTECGEYAVPFRLSCVTGDSLADDQELTPETFAKAAKDTPEAALKLFLSERFLKLSFMNHPELRTLYRGLTLRGNRRGAMEEFLAGSGLKERIAFQIDPAERIFRLPEEPLQNGIRISRNTWGYAALEVQTDSDFICLSSDTVSTDSFEGNELLFAYTIDPQKIHLGVNYGNITFRNMSQSFTVPVRVISEKTGTDTGLHLRRSWIDYGKCYLRLMMGGYDEQTLLTSMQSDLAYIRANSRSDDRAELMHAEVELMLGHQESSALLLTDISDRTGEGRDQDPEIRACFLYLKYLYSGDEEDKKAAQDFAERMLEDPAESTDLILFLYLRLVPTEEENPSLRLTRLKTQFRGGCRNPFLYLEAMRILNLHPELLRMMDEFERQALWFGARFGLVGSRLLKVTAAMTVQERTFHPLYFRMLEKLYEAGKDPEVLSAICVLLIKGDMRGEKWFPWYEKGVCADIRLTRLYEYCLYSMPDQYAGKLPRMIVLYFTYNNTLDYLTQAKLYAYILDHAQEDPSVLDMYSRRMEDFAREQMLDGRINRNLARIYSSIFSPEIMDERMTKMLPRLLHACWYSCDHPAVTSLVLVSAELSEEVVLPLKNGAAICPVYLDNTRVLAQDTAGNRYSGIPVEGGRLMDCPAMEQFCRETCTDNVLLTAEDTARGFWARKEEDVWREKALSLLPRRELSGWFAACLSHDLLSFAGERPEDEKIPSLLAKIDPALLFDADRVTLMELLIQTGNYARAYDLALRFGWDQLKPVRLMRLTSFLIQNIRTEHNEVFLEMARTCFQAKRVDRVILEFLCRNFNGSSRDMFLILLNSREMEAQTYDLEERLLGQMLFTGTMADADKVFQMYQAKGSCDETLILAYYAEKSRRFFLQGEGFGKELAGEMKDVLRRQGMSGLPPICLMALVRRDSLQDTLSPEDAFLLTEMVDTLCRKNYIFACYQDCARFIRLPDTLNGRVVVEYRGESAGQIRIRTRICPEKKESEWETMPRMIEGIYVSTIAVFHGETLEYEIQDLNQGGAVVARGEIAGPEPGPADDRSRIGMMNRILGCMEQSDSEALQAALLDYAATDELIRAAFRPI